MTKLLTDEEVRENLMQSVFDFHLRICSLSPHDPAQKVCSQRQQDLLDEIITQRKSDRQFLRETIEKLDNDKPGEFGDGYKFALQEFLELLDPNQSAEKCHISFCGLPRKHDGDCKEANP